VQLVDNYCTHSIYPAQPASENLHGLLIIKLSFHGRLHQYRRTFYTKYFDQISDLSHVAKNDQTPLQRILTWCRGRGETILLTPSELSVFQVVTYLVIVSIVSHKHSHRGTLLCHHQGITVLEFCLWELVAQP